MNKTEIIRKLNDNFRTCLKGGKVMLTIGIRSKAENEVTEILEKVVNFNDFSKNNDPYLEHDMGRFDHNGEKIIWKIDYYDKNMQYHSPDPSDSTKTVRVMIVMTANEY